MIPMTKLPFLLQGIIATLTGLQLILRPEKQLKPLKDSSKLILQCYGGCLLFTNLISLIFLVRPDIDDTTRLVAFSFAFLHVWPSHRAIVMLQHSIDVKSEVEDTLNRPVVDLAAHGLLVVLFLYTGLSI